jgi:hypothetical protein
MEHVIQISMFLSLYGLSIARGLLLVRGGETLFPEHKEAIRSTRFWASFGLPWCYVINLVALLGSACGRTIVWRGIAYHMTSRTHTVVHRPHAGAVGSFQRESAPLER